MSIEKHSEDVWKYFKSIDKKMYRIKYPSTPIIYFGDYNTYVKSPLKIITVGLNPSHEEFPSEDTFSRFIGAEKIYDKERLAPEDTSTYLYSLNTYFSNNSYKWFRYFEPILNTMNSSFYAGCLSTALHTDFCSPLTTTVTWSDYEKTTDPDLVHDVAQKGSEYWHRLVNILQPNVILISLGNDYRRRIFRQQNLEWTLFEVFDKKASGLDRRTPYEILCSAAELPNDKGCLLVFGANNVVPFMITNEQKASLGKKIYRLVTGNEPSNNGVSSIPKKSDQQKLSEFVEILNTAKKEGKITAEEWRSYMNDYKSSSGERDARLLSDM